MPMTTTELAELICREVAELPDRTSPDDWPDAMLVTHDELREIVLTAIRAMKSTPSEPVAEANNIGDAA